MDILIGLLALAIGIGLTFVGYRVFLVLLPIWGFVVGFWVGSAGMHALFDEHRFLATTTGWIVGIIVGLVFAVLSYLYWYVAVTILGASVGASIGSGILVALGLHQNWLHVIVGLALAVIFAVGVIWLNLPKALVIVYTAAAGAVIAIAGVLLIFDRIDRPELGDGAAVAIVESNIWWLITWAILAAIGIAVQLQSTADFEADFRDRHMSSRPAPATPA